MWSWGGGGVGVKLLSDNPVTWYQTISPIAKHQNNVKMFAECFLNFRGNQFSPRNSELITFNVTTKGSIFLLHQVLLYLMLLNIDEGLDGV